MADLPTYIQERIVCSITAAVKYETLLRTGKIERVAPTIGGHVFALATLSLIVPSW
jgi:hypothetical protein